MLQGRKMADALHNAADYLDGQLFRDSAERCRAGAAEIVRLLDVIRTRDKAIKELQAEIFVSEGSDITKLDALKADAIAALEPFASEHAQRREHMGQEPDDWPPFRTAYRIIRGDLRRAAELHTRLAGAERTEDKDEI